jgi:CDP-diacylglycerol--glycerol-3-phosphate 3-phosphatidyltransferase
MSVSIYQLKPQFQRLLSPALRWLAACGITPNFLTLATMLLMVLYGVALACWPTQTALWLGLPLVLLLRMAFNALDGMLAQATGQKTRLGALLNELGDQVSDAALYLPFALAAGPSAVLVVLTVVLALLAEFAGLAALAAQSARRFDGPMGKSDRAFCFGVLALLLAGGAPALWLDGLLWLMLALLLLTIWNRVRAALRQALPPAA